MKTIKFLITLMFFLPVIAVASIGEIKVSNGEVTIERAGKFIKGAYSTPIEEKDIITTKVHSNAQVIFSDGTAVSVGSNSKFNIQEYLYDEQSSKVNFKASVTEGAFKAVSGRIGKISPDMFKLKTKTATIGIRGTRFLGIIPKDGPDTIACTSGVITVAPLKGVDGAPPPKPVEVKAGEMTKVSDGYVATPQQYNPTQIKDIEKLTTRNCGCK